MPELQNSFQKRLVRINAQQKASRPTPAPDMPPVAMIDRAFLRSEASPLSLRALLDSLFATSPLRYGLPIVIGVFGFSLMANHVPTRANIAVAAADSGNSANQRVTQLNGSEIVISPKNELHSNVKASEETGINR